MNMNTFVRLSYLSLPFLAISILHTVRSEAKLIKLMELQGKLLRSHHLGRSDNPSFSSSLLDAIYRSIDQNSDDNGGKAPEFSWSMLQNKCQKSIEFQCRKPVATERPMSRLNDVSGHCHHDRRGSGGCNYTRKSCASSLSSSAFSRYRDGFSSSASSSEASRTAQSDRVRADSPAQELEMKGKKKKNPNCGSIRSRLRDLRRSSSASATAKAAQMSPVSPGAKLASFLNALFTAAGHAKKTKAAATPATTAVEGGKDSAREESSLSSSPSSSTRSCLRKTPPSLRRQERGKRSVRFCPVSVIVDEDCRPCGHRRLQDESKPTGGNVEAAAAVAAKVKELIIGKPEMEEDRDGESDASSDLFELENWTVIGGGIGLGGYLDELPVYETTDVGTNRAIAQGLTV